ncbi:hypothetical protein JW851_02560 [Candidatus Woesearchaeota archaeon]|nr:hypothetical protein [Candidatus Woesearchaeota archaeon]
MIHNKRFTLKLKKKESEKLLDTITDFFKQKLGKQPLRYAIVDVKKNTLIIDATILEER